MKLSSIITALFIIQLINACTTPKSLINTNTDTHNSQNSLDWNGVYVGTLPCADCEGIRTTIKLSKDMSYLLETKYQGKSENIFKSNGSFSWDKTGSNIIVNAEGEKPKYKVGENMLTMLDKEGKLIAGNLAKNYVLTKENSNLTEKYWKLIEINGKPLNHAKGSGKEAHIVLKAIDNRFTGNSGCNSFSGSFELLLNNQIKFSKIVSTRMACAEMNTEVQLFELFTKVDNFTLADGILSLNRAKMAPLARFEEAKSNK